MPCIASALVEHDIRLSVMGALCRLSPIVFTCLPLVLVKNVKDSTCFWAHVDADFPGELNWEGLSHIAFHPGDTDPAFQHFLNSRLDALLVIQLMPPLIMRFFNIGNEDMRHTQACD